MSQQPPYSPQQPYGAYPPPPQNHPKAVPALVLGILSIVLCGLLTGIPAMIMGRGATREIRAQRGRFGGEGMAQAGFWTGLIGTVLSGFVIVVFVFGAVVAGAFDSTCTTVDNGGNSSHC
jgi:hypothetical protein